MYTCPTCRTEHTSFESAGTCCKADFVECPLSELPLHAELGFGQGTYGYGTVFTRRWELVLNGTPVDQPVRVYPLPLLMSKMVMELADKKYEQGKESVRSEIKRTLGI